MVVLNKAKLVGKNLCLGKNDYETGGIFYGVFLAPKIKYVLTINELGVIEQHMTSTGFNDIKRLLDRSQCFNMLEGKKISAMLTRSWKKSFKNGIVIPTKKRQCNECKNGKLCTTCNNQIKENKEFEANLSLLKGHPPSELGHMLPYNEV